MGRTCFRSSVILNAEELIRHPSCPRWRHSQKRRGRTLKTAPPEHLHLALRIRETPSQATLKMATLGQATLPATTTTPLVGIRDKHLPTTQAWVVHPDRDILLPTPRHSVHQGMRDMGEVLQEPRDTTITPDKVLHLLGEDNTTRGLVLPPRGMICTTEGGEGVATLLDQDTHKEDHQPHHQELLHHQAILQPPNLTINIRKVEMGHNQGAPRARVLRAPRVGCRRRAQG